MDLKKLAVSALIGAVLGFAGTLLVGALMVMPVVMSLGLAIYGGIPVGAILTVFITVVVTHNNPK